MRRLLICVLAVPVAGCFGSRTAEIEYARQRSIDDIARDSASMMVMPACSESPGPWGPPSHRRMRFGDGYVRTRCGLVAVAIASDDFTARFVREACPGMTDEACADTYSDMFFARIGERYRMADWDDVLLKCRAHPVDCKSFTEIELWALASHNLNVRLAATKAMNSTNAKYRRAALEEEIRQRNNRRNAARAIQAAYEGYTDPYGSDDISCTSTSIGGTTTTDCR